MQLMNIHHMDLENADFMDELKRMLEKDYGRSIYRIAHARQIARYTWKLYVIFTDYALLEAELEIETAFPGAPPQIVLNGVYY